MPPNAAALAKNVKADRTPWNPSLHAIKRVKNPLPAPTVCPYCGGTVSIQRNDAIYGRCFGGWPWLYVCDNRKCRAYVGMHLETAIPLGTLADKATRNARNLAKKVFKPRYENGGMTRSEAYVWLAQRLGIANTGECHIGWFDTATCMRVVEVCNQR